MVAGFDGELTVALTWDQSTFESLYTSRAWGHGTRGWNRAISFHYHWWGQKRRINALVAKYLALPGFAQVSDVAIIGGGFGWTAEALAANGVNAISVDTGDYVVANENVSEEGELRALLTAQGLDPDNLPTFMSPNDPNTPLAAGDVWNYWLRGDGVRTSIPIEQEDLSTNGSRRNVKQRLGNNIDAILTEFALDSMTNDAEALAVVESAQQLRPNPACTVVHIVSADPVGDPRLLNKDRAAWRALLDGAGFADHVMFDAGPGVIF